jgi:type II secretory pathway pseudopilin PulG
VVSIIALLIAILLPAIGKARDSALVTQSSGNLRNMGTACAGYGADWNDRQWTAGPDDAGLFGGTCENYLNQAACPPQMILGWSSAGGMWGYWLGSVGNCNVSVGNCGNWPVYKAIEFSGADAGFGYFRLPNAKSFAGYINNKFYDPVFWAPKDKINLAIAEKYFGQADQFNSTGDIAFSTYCFSPAALWSPDVYDKKGFKNPNTLAGGWRSPEDPHARALVASEHRGHDREPELRGRQRAVLLQSRLQQRPGHPVLRRPRLHHERRRRHGVGPPCDERERVAAGLGREGPLAPPDSVRTERLLRRPGVRLARGYQLPHPHDRRRPGPRHRRRPLIASVGGSWLRPGSPA